MRVGVALFHHTNEETAIDTGGWASIEGEPAMMFVRYTDMASDVMWITNLGFEAFRARGFQNVHNLRGDNFFQTSLRQMDVDLRLSLHSPDNSVLAQVLSRIVSRAMHGIQTSYPANQIDRILGTYNLSTGLQTVLCADKSTEEQVDVALEKSWQRHSACDVTAQPWVRDRVVVTLRRNRLAHAMNVLGSLVPAGTWERIPESKLPHKDAEFYLAGNRPFVAQIVMTRINPDVAKILSFGAQFRGRRRGAGPTREWATSNEIAMLCQFASISVKSIYLADRAMPLDEHYQLPETLTHDPLLMLSYSAGLIAEAHLTSVTVQKPTAHSDRKIVSPRATFLASYDRVLTFGYAAMVLQAGFIVSSYGAGSVTVFLEPARLPELEAFARHAGFDFPVSSGVLDD